MPRVKIVTLATLYTAAGGFEHTVSVPEGASALDAIRRLASARPALAREVLEGEGLRSDIRVLVNGRPVESPSSYRVRDGDVIHLIPPAGGG